MPLWPPFSGSVAAKLSANCHKGIIYCLYGMKAAFVAVKLGLNRSVDPPCNRQSQRLVSKFITC
jgi:hypothetical protein